MVDTLKFTIELAQRAGELLLQYYSRTILPIGLKNDQSIVTEADFASDELISKSIREVFPDSIILSEELATSITSPEFSNDRSVWIVDPLDGTTNFSLGMHIWGVLITRLVGGVPAETVHYFPALQELYTARHGEGVWMNGKAIRVQPPRKDRPTTFFSCCSRTYHKYQLEVPYKTRILGSAGYSFCCLARGAALISFEATAKIWDIIGAWLIVSEAGGFIETLDGSQPLPLLAEYNYAQINFPVLATATQKLMDKTHSQIHLLV
jgi:myo-inositol-1(or 4)-monophosphatase